MKRLLVSFAAAVTVLGQGPAPRTPLGLDAYMPVPDENPLTPEKIALGRKLFFDMRLSRTEDVSCATCHDVKRAFTDGRSVAAGVLGRQGTRNAPTLVNRGYGTSQFWDGRSRSLEEQVLKPIQDPNEMDLTLKEASSRVGLSPREMAQSLASYVRSIRAGDSAFDRYMHGDYAALNPEQLQGLNLFRVKANCIACHVGPNFSDEKFHNTGVAWENGGFRDEGRIVVSGRPEDRGAFRTPTLREVSRTAPYMHDGSIAAIEDVVEFYDRGGNKNPDLDAEIRPLRLNDVEKKALAAFLKALTGVLVEGGVAP